MTDTNSPNPEPLAAERDDSAWLDWAAESRRHIQAAGSPWALAGADVQARALLDIDGALLRAGVELVPLTPGDLAQAQHDQQWAAWGETNPAAAAIAEFRAEAAAARERSDEATAESYDSAIERMEQAWRRHCARRDASKPE